MGKVNLVFISNEGEKIVSQKDAMAADLVMLQSSDMHNFATTLANAEMSATLKDLIDDAGIENIIPLPQIDGETLRCVIEYCNEFVGKEVPNRNAENTTLNNWEESFVKNLDQDQQFRLIMASNYLDVKGLLDMMCCNTANGIKGKTPEELRKMFGITEEFTEEETKKVREEHGWTEDHE